MIALNQKGFGRRGTRNVPIPPPSYDDGLTDNVEKISNYAQLIIYTYVSAVCQRGGQILCGGVRVAF